MQKIIFLKNSFENRSYKKHFHNTYSISLITEGVCSIEIKGVEYVLNKGHFRIINPYELHEITCSSWEHINLVLSSQLLNFILGYKKDSVVCFENVVCDEKLAREFHALYEQKNSLDNEKLREFLLYLAERHTLKKTENDVLNVDKIKLAQAIELINQNINNNDINLEKLALSVKLSKYHLIREFKKIFGLTPHHYIQNIKINRAMSMLCEEEPLSLSQIALESGFFDQSHFIKTYKKFFGHNPSKAKK